jgi:hypothetical protein
MEPRRTRKKTKQPPRTLGVALLSAGAAALGIGATLAALLLRRRAAPADGHPVPDLAPETTVPPIVTTPSSDEPVAAALAPEERATEHFRPDPTAVPTAEEREALRPATGPVPGFAADRGSSPSDAQDAA